MHAKNNGWYGATLMPVTASITATDDVSEVSSIEFQIDGGAWTTYSTALIICGTATQTGETCDVTSEGTVSVAARATDTAGNTSVPVTADLQIDTIAPTVDPTQTSGTEEGDVLLILTGTDTTSGVQSVEYSTDGGSNWTSATSGLSDTGGGNAPFLTKIGKSNARPDYLYAVGAQGPWRSTDSPASSRNRPGPAGPGWDHESRVAGPRALVIMGPGCSRLRR